MAAHRSAAYRPIPLSFSIFVAAAILSGYASHGRMCISEVNGRGCIALTARPVSQGSTRALEATSAEPVSGTHPTQVSSSALKAEPTIRRVSSAFCWMVKPSYQRHFRSAHHGCTGAHTSGSRREGMNLGGRAVETDAEAIPRLCQPRCVHRPRNDVEINWQPGLAVCELRAFGRLRSRSAAIQLGAALEFG